MRAGPLTTRGHWARLLGYALSIAVVGVLVAWFLGRIGDLSDEAEQLAFENNLTALRHAVHIESMRVLANEGAAGLRSRVGANALAWIEWNPDAASDAAPRSSWTYNGDRGLICHADRGDGAASRCWRVEVDEVVDPVAVTSDRVAIRLRLEERR